MADTGSHYTPEEKEKALQLCIEIGVLKTSEETGIAATSLYKWRAVKEERNAVPLDEIASQPVKSENTEQISEHKGSVTEHSIEDVNVPRLQERIGVSLSRQRDIDMRNTVQVTDGGEDAPPFDETFACQNSLQAGGTGTDNAVSLTECELLEMQETMRLQLENAFLKTQVETLQGALRALLE